MKLAAESDFTISADAFRLLCRLISRVYTDRFAYAHEQFPLSHRIVNRLLGSVNRTPSGRNTGRSDMGQGKQTNPRGQRASGRMLPPPHVFTGCSKKTAYGRVQELERALYVKRTEVRGCPPTGFYRLRIGRFNKRP